MARGHDCGPEPLHASGHQQRCRVVGESTHQTGQGEHEQAAEEDPAPAVQVGEPSPQQHFAYNLSGGVSFNGGIREAPLFCPEGNRFHLYTVSISSFGHVNIDQVLVKINGELEWTSATDRSSFIDPVPWSADWGGTAGPQCGLWL